MDWEGGPNSDHSTAALITWVSPGGWEKRTEEKELKKIFWIGKIYQEMEILTRDFSAGMLIITHSKMRLYNTFKSLKIWTNKQNFCKKKNYEEDSGFFRELWSNFRKLILAKNFIHSLWNRTLWLCPNNTMKGRSKRWGWGLGCTEERWMWNGKWQGQERINYLQGTLFNSRLKVNGFRIH